MICKNCGCENRDGNAFCAECGALLTQAAPAPETYAPAQPDAAPQPAPFAPSPEQPAPQPYYNAPPRYQEPAVPPMSYGEPAPVKEKGKGGKIALIVTVCVLALALVAAGVFCYLLYTEKQEKEQEDGALRVQLKEIAGKYETLSGDYNVLSGDYDELTAKYDTLSGDYDTLSGQYDELDAAYEEMSDYANDLYEEYSGMYDAYYFFTTYGVICSDMNQYYHAYDCEDWDHSAFWIYNIDAAKSKEFTPCPKCMADADGN